jgi:hypothetical protein
VGPLRFPKWQGSYDPPSSRLSILVPEGALRGDRTPGPGPPNVTIFLGTRCAGQIGHCADGEDGGGGGDQDCSGAVNDSWGATIPQPGRGSNVSPFSGSPGHSEVSHLFACP